MTLTDDQIIEKVAMEVMGWKKKSDEYWIDAKRNVMYPIKDILWHGDGLEEGWNPLTSWDHWRQVEEKLLDGPWELFVTELVPACSVDTDWAMHAYAATDLRSRCLAAIEAVASCRA
jgi:hypothetical protein